MDIFSLLQFFDSENVKNIYLVAKKTCFSGFFDKIYRYFISVKGKAEFLLEPNRHLHVSSSELHQKGSIFDYPSTSGAGQFKNSC